MANFLVEYNKKLYANRRFVDEMISYKVINKKLFQFKTITVLDQVLFEVSDDIKDKFKERKPNLQNLDEQLKILKPVSSAQVSQAKENMKLGFPNSYVITLMKSLMPSTYDFEGISFYKYSEYKKRGAYSTAVMTKIPTVKLFGALYAAIDCIRLGVDKPIVITKEL